MLLAAAEGAIVLAAVVASASSSSLSSSALPVLTVVGEAGGRQGGGKGGMTTQNEGRRKTAPAGEWYDSVCFSPSHDKCCHVSCQLHHPPRAHHATPKAKTHVHLCRCLVCSALLPCSRHSFVRHLLCCCPSSASLQSCALVAHRQLPPTAVAELKLKPGRGRSAAARPS